MPAMDRAALETKRSQLQAELQQISTQKDDYTRKLHQYEGAVLLLNDLISEFPEEVPATERIKDEPDATSDLRHTSRRTSQKTR